MGAGRPREYFYTERTYPSFVRLGVVWGENLRLLQIPSAREGFERAIVRFLNVRGKTATGQFAVLQVRLEAIAADRVVGASGVGACAECHVAFFVWALCRHE